ncbi:MAG: hypothetical protein IJV24_07045 [Prevotella sp.]|nr:hypothetical protein [Prevotella sp.]
MTDKQLNIVITGCFTEQALGHYGRTELKATIEAAGHKVRSQLSAQTDYLVIGTAVPGRPPGPSKLAQAKTLGIPVVTLAEFRKIAA